MASPLSLRPAKRPLDGMEVPIPSSDTVRWIELTVPSSLHLASHPVSSPATPSRNAAACHIVTADDPAYIIWRIHKDIPNAVEIIEIYPHREFPETGLRLIFPQQLFPFAFVCRDENASGTRYFLYAVTDSGVAYLFKLESLYLYSSGSALSQSDFIEFLVEGDREITAVAATFGSLLIGRQDGLVTCYKLGFLEQSSPGFMTEFRDDMGIGRLWNLVSRGKTIAMVKDLVISQVCGQKLVFVLHLDGTLRVWDLMNRSKILTHDTVVHQLTGYTPLRIWVGDPDYDASIIPVAVSYEFAVEPGFEMIALHCIHFGGGDKISLSADSPAQPISLDQGKIVDLILSKNKLWILKEEGSMMYDLLHSDTMMDHVCSYGLLEDFISDQLFQGPDQPSDVLIWNESTLLSSKKEEVPYIVSSMFLHRLLQPGINQNGALRASILGHRKYLADFELQSLNVANLRKEIFSIIESEGVGLNPISVFQHWKNFCTQFFRNWNEANTPYSLFVDSANGSIGLIRKGSISMFRNLENFELLFYGSHHEICNSSDADNILLMNDLHRDIIFDVLKCMSNINHQLGRAASAVMFMSIMNPEVLSFDDIVSHLVKILETGYCSPITSTLTTEIGVDDALNKRHLDHKRNRKFSVEMMLSLQELYAKASTWERVLNVVENYLQSLIPKHLQSLDKVLCFDTNSSLLVQATSQMAKVVLESSFDILLLLRYLVNVNMQVNMGKDDILRIMHKLIPMTQDILMHWLTIFFVVTTPTESPLYEDFSSRLSSLHIDNKTEKISFDVKLGTSSFSLAYLLGFPVLLKDQGFLFSGSFPPPGKYDSTIMNLCSWIIWGKTGGSTSFSLIFELSSALLSHGQYEAAENLLVITHAHSNRKKESEVQFSDTEWCACLHLLGFCILVRAHSGSYGARKDEKLHEAIRCFFRASSAEGAHLAFRNLSFQTGLQHSVETESDIVWKFHYYQWVMQTFEQYDMSDGACQFALAALEQVDEVASLSDGALVNVSLLEPATTIRGRLWANVFKFTLDLNYYRDAYCAIISNPDDDSKYICLRRFIIVLCERGATKQILCDGNLPFVGLLEKVGQELFWKAERSDITLKPNLYKLLYSFESYRNNWRQAANYMYHYTVRLRKEANVKEHPQLSLVFQERIWGLSAAISALQLVNPAYAWLDSLHGDYCDFDQYSQNKMARKSLGDNASTSAVHRSSGMKGYFGIETLENEYVLASAQYLLVPVKEKSMMPGNYTDLESMISSLIRHNFYDMAFTVLLKFWKGSALKRELEKAFVALTEKCCENTAATSFIGLDAPHGFLLSSSKDVHYRNGKADALVIYNPRAMAQWETLELHLEKYKKLHPRLPVTVAETLLRNDPQIELPLWLVHMFKGGIRSSWGMTGQEADPAILFRLYIDYRRFPEATNMLLEYLESFISMRPTEILNRKRMCAIWFPYAAIENLWCQLEEMQNCGRMVDQCVKLKGLLKGALLEHLNRVKLDSVDALASALA